jgi:hypothetical protein
MNGTCKHPSSLYKGFELQHIHHPGWHWIASAPASHCCPARASASSRIVLDNVSAHPGREKPLHRSILNLGPGSGSGRRLARGAQIVALRPPSTASLLHRHSPSLNRPQWLLCVHRRRALASRCSPGAQSARLLPAAACSCAQQLTGSSGHPMSWPPPTWTALWLATMVSRGDGDACLPGTLPAAAMDPGADAGGCVLQALTPLAWVPTPQP